MKLGNFDKAERILKQALSKDPCKFTSLKSICFTLKSRMITFNHLFSYDLYCSLLSMYLIIANVLPKMIEEAKCQFLLAQINQKSRENNEETLEIYLKARELQSK